MNKPTYSVLVSAPYILPHIGRFGPVFKYYEIELILPEVLERLSEEGILRYAGQFDGTICGDDAYSEKVIRACLPRLRVISKWGTGIDSIDKIAAVKLGVMVGNTPNAFTLPVADSVLGYILAFARKLPWMDDTLKRGEWAKVPGKSLSECTLGVVGVGHVGKAVLRRAKAFGMKLLGNDIQTIDPAFIHEIGVEMTTLSELLKQSDFISLNADLNSTSRRLINGKTLNMMKQGAVIINTARGAIIHEMALIQALKNKKIAGAALDVFEVEPLPSDSPLLEMDNVMLAAHNSNSSPTAWENVHWNTIHNLLEGLGVPHQELDQFKNKQE